MSLLDLTYPNEEEAPVGSLAWMIMNGPTLGHDKARRQQLLAEEKYELSCDEVFNKVYGRNVTAKMLQEEMGWSKERLMSRLRALVKDGRLVSWRIGNAYWYSAARGKK